MGSSTQNPERLSAPEGEGLAQILYDYEGLLANSAPSLGCVADISELPHSKQRLKDAITAGMAGSTRTRRDELRMAYLALAGWQAGVGDRHLELTLLKPSVRRINREPAPVRDTDTDHWNVVVVDEQKMLARELAAMGLGSI